MTPSIYGVWAQATVPGRDALSTLTDIASIVASAAVVVLVVMGILVLLQLNRAATQIRAEVRARIGPVSDRARTISDDVAFITDAVRTDVHKLNRSVHALTEQIHQASDLVEARVEEFNALVEVVQSEAEDLFLDTAATVRGVREGARSIAMGKNKLQRTLHDAHQGSPEGEIPSGEEAR